MTREQRLEQVRRLKAGLPVNGPKAKRSRMVPAERAALAAKAQQLFGYDPRKSPGDL